MDSTVSVSKGCFVVNKMTISKGKNRSRKSQNAPDNNPFCSEAWYSAYKKMSSFVAEGIENVFQEVFTKVLQELVSYVKTSYEDPTVKLQNILPVATLLTGMNMPDHDVLFEKLVNLLNRDVTPFIAMLRGRECKNIKTAVENMVSQFMKSSLNSEYDASYDDDDDELMEEKNSVKLKKGQLNFMVLYAWYNSMLTNNYNNSKTEEPENSPLKTNKDASVLKIPRQLVVKIESLDMNKVKGSVICQENRSSSSPVKSPNYYLRSPMKSMESPQKSSSKVKVGGTSPRKNLFGTPTKTLRETSKVESPAKCIFGSPRKVNLIDNEHNIYNSSQNEMELNHQSQKPLSEISSNYSLRTPRKNASMTPKKISDELTSPKKKVKYDATDHVLKPDILSSKETTFKPDRKLLVVIIPDFECFSRQVLHDLLQISSVYSGKLPIVFVLGVATSAVALQQSLPYHVSSRVCLELFQTPPSIDLLNQVLEQVLLTNKCPFHLGNKTFKLLTDIFLFYNFSVKDFIKGFKICLMEHYFQDNRKSLCCSLKELNKNLMLLSSNDLEGVRSLATYRKYVESRPKSERVGLLLDDDHTKVVIKDLMEKLHCHLFAFHVALKCLNAVTSSLPKSPLGKQIRELYSVAISTPIYESPAYKECVQLLRFLSQEDLLKKMDGVISILQNASFSLELNHHENFKTRSPRKESSNPNISKTGNVFKSELSKLQSFKEDLEKVNIQNNVKSPLKSPTKMAMGENFSRAELKEKLLEMSKKEKEITPYEKLRNNVLSFVMEEFFPKFLTPLNQFTLSELLLFDDITNVRGNIVGTPRPAIHTALTNPHIYLQCDCCKIEDKDTILASMPDICIAFKLYLEFGRLINLYDWLVAFATIVNPSEDDDPKIDPHVQARFSQAVDELQFLGFLKPAGRKTDHVMKLTWSK